MPRWLEIQLVDRKKITSVTSIFNFKYNSEELLSWVPGQFVTMDLPIGSKRLDRWRSYSIANNPNKENIIQLCIVRVPKGRATTYLFQELSPGQTISIKKPSGAFILPDDLNRSIVMICTGTGIAPFKSMLEHIVQNNLDFKSIHLIFGSRHRRDILFYAFFCQLAHDFANFEYNIALSREEFGGYKGYVHDLYKSRYTDVCDNNLFYLCGWQNMIDEAENNLINIMGYGRSQVIAELYG